MPKPADLAYAFGLPPADAVAYFEAKGYAITWSWRELADQARARAFTIAGVMRLDVLQDIRAAVGKALAAGQTPREFSRALAPLLERKGWWGRGATTHPQTGEVAGKPLTPRRLQTIFATNLQSAYMAGRYRQFADNVASRPYWQYVAVLDARTRPAHRALNGRVFRHDDPGWASFWPPNGYRCRCRVRALSAADVSESDIALSSTEGRLSQAQVPAGRGTDAPTATVTRFEHAPGKYFAPDPGFNFNAGQEWLRPFTPPPLDTLPRSFGPGVALPDLPAPARVSPARLLADDLPPEQYAKAFLAEFGADVGQPVTFRDATGSALAIGEALFQDGAGNWKAAKDGRGPYMRLLADAVKSPDEIWMRWEASRERPGQWLLKRRYIRSFEVTGIDGPQYGLSVFEWGRDGWTGSTAMLSQADRAPAARRRYIERQRDGFLAYRK